jgi:allantoin racemase
VINQGPLTYKLAETLLALGLSQSDTASPRPNVQKIAMVRAPMARAAESGGPRVSAA